jgi:cytochrome c2
MKTFTIMIAAAAFICGTAVAVSAQDAKAGEALYGTKKCATCHQIKGQGNKVASALDDVGTKLTAADIKKWFTATDALAMEAKLPKKPIVTMSSWLKTNKLADADIDALVAYMQTLKK